MGSSDMEFYGGWSAIRQQVIKGTLVGLDGIEGDGMISGTRGAVSDSAIL